MNEEKKQSEIMARLELLHNKVFDLITLLNPCLSASKTIECSEGNSSLQNSPVMSKINGITETVNYIIEDLEIK